MRSSPTAVRFLLLLLCSNTHTHPLGMHRHPAQSVSSVWQREPGLLGVFSYPSSARSPFRPPKMGPAKPYGLQTISSFGGQAGEWDTLS